jgi:CDGSH-type Zn-finger protein
MQADRPYRTQVTAGEMVFWCVCGRSEAQPYCDGSHRGTVHRPLRYMPSATLVVALCGCKQTKQPPFCDGSHLAFRAAQDAEGARTLSRPE